MYRQKRRQINLKKHKKDKQHMLRINTKQNCNSPVDKSLSLKKLLVKDARALCVGKSFCNSHHITVTDLTITAGPMFMQTQNEGN